jgi:acyl-CoA reductase-like NAD-dependent aldehyde dehydrogenase
MDVISTLWELDTLESANDYLASHGSNAPRLHHFIDGYFGRYSESVKWIESLNPRSGKLLVQIPNGPVTEVDRAVDAASRAFPAWSKTSRHERSQVLMRISDILSDKKELFAVWESIDQGKTLARARVEVERAISNFRLVLFSLAMTHSTIISALTRKKMLRDSFSQILCYIHSARRGSSAIR